MRPRNKAEAEPANFLGELSVLEDPLLRLARLDALCGEWTEHSREAKAVATTKFIRKELKAGERVLVWSGKERSRKDKCHGADGMVGNAPHRLGTPNTESKRSGSKTITKLQI